MPTAVLDAPDRPLTDRVLADQVNRVDPAPFFALTEALVRLAQADLAHRCSRVCEHRALCAQRRASARTFLGDLRRGGRADSIWAGWLHLAAQRAQPSGRLASPSWLDR